MTDNSVITSGKFRLCNPSGMLDNSVTMAEKLKTDPARQRLVELAELKGTSLSRLSADVLRKNRSYLENYIRKNSPAALAYEDRVALARALGPGVTEADLNTASAKTVAGSDGIMQPSLSGNPTFLTGEQDLPILGRVKGGEEALFIDNGETAGFTMRPHVLRGVTEAYAVEVHDVSMEPALRHGWLCWIHPHKAVKPGDDVVVQLNDGQAYVKHLVRRTERELVLRQWNPQKDIKIPRADVKAVHLIVGSLRITT